MRGSILGAVSAGYQTLGDLLAFDAAGGVVTDEAGGFVGWGCADGRVTFAPVAGAVPTWDPAAVAVRLPAATDALGAPAPHPLNLYGSCTVYLAVTWPDIAAVASALTQGVYHVRLDGATGLEWSFGPEAATAGVPPGHGGAWAANRRYVLVGVGGSVFTGTNDDGLETWRRAGGWASGTEPTTPWLLGPGVWLHELRVYGAAHAEGTVRRIHAELRLRWEVLTFDAAQGDTVTRSGTEVTAFRSRDTWQTFVLPDNGVATAPEWDSAAGCLRFARDSDTLWLSTHTLNLFAPCTVYVVVSWTAAATAAAIFRHDDDASTPRDRYYFYLSRPTNGGFTWKLAERANFPSVTAPTVNGWVADTRFVLAVAAGNSSAVLYAGNEAWTNAVFGTASRLGPAATTPWTLGGGPGSGFSLYEMRMYDRLHDRDTMRTVHGELCDKWSVSY